MTCNVFGGTLNLTLSVYLLISVVMEGELWKLFNHYNSCFWAIS